MRNYQILRLQSFLILSILFASHAIVASEIEHSKLVSHFKNDYRSSKHSLEFKAILPASNTEEKNKVITTTQLIIDGVVMDQPYNLLARSGDQFPDSPFPYGQLINAEGKPITSVDQQPEISHYMEFSSLLAVHDKLFMLSQFETAPAAIYQSELQQDNDGKLSILNTKPVDFSGVNGGWVHCAASVTPWNTHLASEEYEPNAALIDPRTGIHDESSRYMANVFSRMARYKGGEQSAISPYDYGWQTEIEIVNAEGQTHVNKHYSMGRLSFELGRVLDDRKTTYMSDDGTNVGFWMFIADQPGDLSQGVLYGAKWQQISSDRQGGAAHLGWISLGHATDSEIRKIMDTDIGFHDIFETSEPQSQSCSEGFTLINTLTGKECLKVKEGMQLAASRLETRRYGAMLGVTTEFRKEEGIAYDPVHKRLFVAMSDIGRGMEDNAKYGKQTNSFDLAGSNHIKQPYNRCGAIYALDLISGQRDTAGNLISSQLVAANMYSVLNGNMTRKWWSDSVIPEYPESGNFSANRCDINSISNPDNIHYISEYNIMLIAEDTAAHENNVMWSWDLSTDKLTRILSAPLGAEITSPYYYNDINGFGYIMSVIQHPFQGIPKDEQPESGAHRSYVSYFGPFPPVKE